MRISVRTQQTQPAIHYAEPVQLDEEVEVEEEELETRMYRMRVTRTVYADQDGYVYVEATSEDDAQERFDNLSYREMEDSVCWGETDQPYDYGDTDFSYECFEED